MSFMRILPGLCLALACAAAHADRIKDIATVMGVRPNPLVGYGLVVGLDGTGDQTTQTPYTIQSIVSMLGQLGVQLPPGVNLQPKNIASVMVTATLPPFARAGQAVDVTVSSLGNAKSLRGGTLIMTPLKGADTRIYAVAQGNLLVGGAGASAGGSSAQVNHLSAGRIPGGATVEREVPAALGQGEFVHLDLKEADFTTAARVVNAVNRAFGPNAAQASDSRQISVRAPQDPNRRVAFIAELESLDLNPSRPSPRVIVNARTGSVVMNQAVTLEQCAVAHGNLSVVISTTPVVSQPGAFSGGETVTAQQSEVSVKADAGELVTLPASVSLADVVKALNAVGATPQDLLSILQAMKASGALKAELEII
jgi:flagellar P-ring protein precursor FlgI